MSASDPRPLPPCQPSGARRDRRRFLMQVGLLLGSGALPFVAPKLLARKPRRLEASRPALGTWVRVVVNDGDPGRASRAVERAFEAIQLVDAQMSIHRADSQVTRVNLAAGEETVPVDPAVLGVVERSLAASRRTRGLYDATVLPLMRLFGFYGSGRDRYPSDREIAAALDVTGWRHVIVDRPSGRLGLAKRGVALDLGSIGKGWALDKAVEALRSEGVTSALVDVGGNVFGLGVPDDGEEGWSVGVIHPGTGRVDRVFTLRDAAVATSGNSEQSHFLGRVRVGHLLDALRGRPASGYLSATAEARSGVESDLFSTVAFLLGPDRFRGYPGALDAHFIG
jgi:FAD:protein FMN transferase